ncbi:Gfo/Idh/MocA family protein [Sedimentimonas flavescens]|uniref:Gfo/Idh/MocA family protein n=1 Tax=Sedimentimonas flavescens TaxID=2851012 RepID=UPI001F33BD33|nr:Gfo/Idh/MocA family oxidoreductase [Sedimentimonas flavescens]
MERSNGGQNVKWALLGASTIAGQYMVSAIRAQTDGAVRWVVSGKAERARAFAQAHRIELWSTSVEEALEDQAVQAVYISTTNEKHYPLAMAAIGAGKHVLCEKPLAMDAAEAAEMVSAARSAGVTLAVNHHLRSAGSHKAIRALITSGALGRVLSLRLFHAVHLPEHLRGWRLDNPSAGGGVIMDLTVHNADTVRFLLREDPASVIAETATSGMGAGVEDSAMSVWTMPSGAMVFSHESFTHPFTESGIEVHGTQASVFARGVMAQEPLGRIELVSKQGRGEISFDAAEIYGSVIEDFQSAVARRASPAATGTDGAKSLMVARAVHDAARTGARQTINYGEIE